jgi:uncharacterized protein YdhG (YjbR/CyaY superfamily)
MKTDYKSIDHYISNFPISTQNILKELRAIIREAAPAASEKISYQIPTFFQNGNLVHFAAYEKHIGFYPTSSGIQAFKSELRKYKTAKGSVQFPIDEPLPLKLVKKIVAFRVKENSTKKTKGEKK